MTTDLNPPMPEQGPGPAGSPASAAAAPAASAPPAASSPVGVPADPPPVVEPPAAGAPAAAPTLKVGSLVLWDYFDAYSGAGGEDITWAGIVVGVRADGATARVAWLREISDPLPVADLRPA